MLRWGLVCCPDSWTAGRIKSLALDGTAALLPAGAIGILASLVAKRDGGVRAAPSASHPAARVLHEQREQYQRLHHHELHAQAVLTDLTQFCDRIHRQLPAVTLAEQQALLQLLIDRRRFGMSSTTTTKATACRIPIWTRTFSHSRYRRAISTILWRFSRR
jgi:hypothetical protein